MDKEEHYLKRELYELMQSDKDVFEFLQIGSLDGIWYWDLVEQEHEWMSPRFWEVLGYDPATKQHLASEWQDLIFSEDLAVAISNLEKHLADPDHPYDQDVRYKHRDGSTVWVRCRGIAIRDESGKPVRLLGAHTDLTSLKRTEEELRQKTIELEAANEQLRNAADRIRSLEKLLPICMFCKKIRDDADEWQPLEDYISDRTGSAFSHGLCPECRDAHFAEREG